MSCIPPSPREWRGSGHYCCCKPLRFLSRAALLLLLVVVALRLCCSASDACRSHSIPFIIHLGAERALAGWLAGWAGAPKSSTSTSTLTTATALQQSPADACCVHALVLYYCRRRGSSCMMPTTPSTPVYSCYECRRAEWPADGLKFGGTDKEGKLLLLHLISPSSTPLTFLFPFIHLLFLLLSCSIIHLLSSC